MRKAEAMVLPRKWKTKVFSPNSTLEPNYVCYRIHKESVQEHCQFRNNIATCYLKMTGKRLRQIRTDFNIRSVLYAKLEGVRKMRDYLVMAGDHKIYFHDLITGEEMGLAVPFRIQRVLASEYGILIERFRVRGDEKSGETDIHLYSLVHPMGEILPVLYNMIDNAMCNYAFARDNITLLPSPDDNPENFFLGYDATNKRHVLYVLRKATKEERTAAAKLGTPLNYTFDSTLNDRTPSGLRTGNSTPRGNLYETPLRRSFRNRMKQMVSDSSGTPALGDFSRSSAYQDSSNISFNSGGGIRQHIKNNFRIFNLDGEETDELMVDFCLQCVWTEPPNDLNYSVSTPQILTPNTATSITPRSILRSRVGANSPFATPRVTFTSTPVEGSHKRPIIGEPPLDQPCSSTTIPQPAQERAMPPPASPEALTVQNLNEFPNERLLTVLDDMIARQRFKIMGVLKSKSLPQTNITPVEYMRARRRAVLHYVSLCQSKIATTPKAMKHLYALILYRRRIFHLVANQKKTRAAELLHKRIATRFFLTSDLHGYRYICFMPGGENKLKLLKWDYDKSEVSGPPMTIDGFDAVHVLGLKLLAVMNPQKTAISLYTGTALVGTLVMPPFQYKEYELLQLVDGPEEYVQVKIQKCKTLHVELCQLNVSYGYSSEVKLVFEAVFAALPMSKALAFFSRWCADCHNYAPMYDMYASEDYVYFEVPILMKHFFAALGLMVTNLQTSVWLGDDEMMVPNADGTIPKRTRLTGDEQTLFRLPVHFMNISDTLKRMFNMEQTINVVRSDQFSDIMGKHAFVLFNVFHLFLESLYIQINSEHIIPLLLEPLYVFVTITNMNSLKEYYTKAACIKINKINVLNESKMPDVKEAINFTEQSVVTFNDFFVALNTPGGPPPVIPKSPHWPLFTCVCAAVLCGKITNAHTLRQSLGSCWQKRLMLSECDEKKLLCILANREMDLKNKCIRCMHLFNVSTGDLRNLAPRFAELFFDVVVSLTQTIKKHGQRFKLKLLPTRYEQNRWLRMRFPTDIRAENLARMLDTTMEVLIPVRHMGNADDEVVNREQHDYFLMANFPKTVAKTFGRAAFNFQTEKFSHTGMKEVPPVVLSGRVPPNNLFQEFPVHDVLSRTQDWIDFYACVSHTIRTTAPPASISINWLQQGLSSGMIFAHGIVGHLRKLSSFDLHQLLVKAKKPIDKMALLLGCSISARSTGDSVLYRVVCTYQPSFLDPAQADFKNDPNIHSTVLLSIGFLFLGSTNSSISTKLVDEMAKEAIFEGEHTAERYGYVLCAGIAFGLINLARGVELREAEPPIAGFSHDFDERLENIMNGRPRAECTSFGRQNKKLCRVQLVDVAGLHCHPNMTTTADRCTLLDRSAIHGIGYPADKIGAGSMYHDQTRYSANAATGTLAKDPWTVRELDTVNPHIGSPAACIALGLAYLRTNDKYAMRILAVPDSLTGLERYRPDVLMMMTLCRLLIGYDNMQPTEAFLEQQIPAVLRDFVRYFNDCNGDRNKIYWMDYIDFESVVAAYLNIRCGAVLAIGIRYASTYNKTALETIRRFCIFLEPIPTTTSRSIRYFVREYVVRTLGAIATMAQALVMTGSGDLQTLRMIRQVRNYVHTQGIPAGDPFTFSVNAYANMALGFLFLGNCRYGFGRSNEAIASLLISLWPACPHSISDNRMYLQPMRLLWVLAAEYRHICPVDDENCEPVMMSANIRYKNGTTETFQMPGVLPPFEDISVIEFTANHFHTVTFDLSIKSDLNKLTKILKEYHGRMPVRLIVLNWRRLWTRVYATRPKYDSDLAPLPSGFSPPSFEF